MLFVHVGQPLEPHDVAAAWTRDPLIVLPLVVIGALYSLGVCRLWRASDRGRGVSHWRVACFAIGWLTLALALVSPLHAMGSVLFSAHMVQHELLMTMAAPLLILGRPLISFVWGLPSGARPFTGTVQRRLGPVFHVIGAPLIAWTIHAIAILGWHLPAPYQATLTSDVAHFAQHASFLGSALLFWWTVIERRPHSSGNVGAVAYLFTTMMYTGILGALLTFSSTLWYPAYAVTTGPWGLSPIEDQQLGGLIMWIPGSVSYVLAALIILGRALNAERFVPRAASVALLVLCVGVAGSCREPDQEDVARAITGGDTKRGKEQIRKFGCGSCHVIPGVAGANGKVGPPLTGVASRMYIGGVLTNTPPNLMRWIMTPQDVDSLTAMPNLGVGDGEARDIAAYLYTLR